MNRKDVIAFIMNILSNNMITMKRTKKGEA
jgi:hypothetical protein